MEIKGIIRQVAREGKAVMLDNDMWFSHFNAVTLFKVGDAVKITYTDSPPKADGTIYHNWKIIESDDGFTIGAAAPGEVERPYGKENYQVEHEPGSSGRIFNGEKPKQEYPPHLTKKQEYHLSPEECRCRALECALRYWKVMEKGQPTEEFVLTTANKFLEFIENRTSAAELGLI